MKRYETIVLLLVKSVLYRLLTTILLRLALSSLGLLGPPAKFTTLSLDEGDVSLKAKCTVSGGYAKTPN